MSDPYYDPWKNGSVNVNRKDVHLCPDQKWLQCDEKPITIETLVVPSQKLAGYRRKEEFAGLDIGVPSTVDIEYFRDTYDGEYSHREHNEFYSFYEGIYEQPEPYWQTLDNEIIIASLDAEPTPFDFPVRVSPPECFSKYPEVHYQFPCSITSDNLFDYLYDKVQSVVKASKNLTMDNYKSIKTFTVKRRFVYSEPKEKRRDISRWGAKKPKYEKYKESEIWTNIFSIRGASYKTEYGDYGVVPTIEAKNYAELKVLVDEYINTLLDQLDDNKIQECHHCKGRGWTYEGQDR
jgi:hypothetical protein